MRNKSIKIKKNNFIYFIFCFFVFIILFLTVGFSAYSERLSIDGSALVRSSADVRITDVQRVNSSDDVELKSLNLESNGTFSIDCKLKTIWSKVYFEVTVTNLSSSNVLVTNVEELVPLNSHMQYELIDMEINKTVIPAASEYKFTVCFSYIDSFIDKWVEGSFEIMDQWANPETSHMQTALKFTFYKIPQYNYEITATPSDSLITLESDGNVVASGTGYVKALVNEGSNVSWSVSKDGYYTESGVDTITGAVSKNVALREKIERTFTVTPSQSDAVVTLKVNGEVMATGNGTQSIDVLDETVVDYTVTKFEYADVTGSYTINGSNYTMNVTLVELPWITGTFTNTNRESATTKEDTVYHPGYYLIELWGGKGGTQYDAGDNKAGYGGAAGNIYGLVYLEYGNTIYYTLGGNGKDGALTGVANGGANGGGNAYGIYAAAGAGYSAFAINTTSISQSAINSGNVLMIAGGGGGGASNSTTVSTRKPGDGGAGGNMNSTTSSINLGTVFHGANGTLNDGTSHTYGLGGTTTSTTLSKAGKAGGLLSGGAALQKGGGGGAGYYGGAGGAGGGTSKADGAGGGGGGSSFIASSVTFSGLSSSVTSNLVSSNPSSSGGAIVITYLGKSI